MTHEDYKQQSQLITPDHDRIVRYDLSNWEAYASLFARFTTPAQVEVYEAASLTLSGRVLDAGSGSGKMAMYLYDKPQIVSYTGVDYSEAMVVAGNKILRKIDRPSYKILHCLIEEVTGSFDSAVSIQSFYSWSDPEVILARIYNILIQGGIFVLASGNEKLELKPLIRDAEKMLIGQPEFEEYKQFNLRLAENSDGNFITLDELIRLAQKIGFCVLDANQKHFQGGLNFLVLQKQNSV